MRLTPEVSTVCFEVAGLGGLVLLVVLSGSGTGDGPVFWWRRGRVVMDGSGKDVDAGVGSCGGAGEIASGAGTAGGVIAGVAGGVDVFCDAAGSSSDL